MPEYILVVDDDRDIAQVIKVTLESKAFEVELAYDGKQALASAKRRKPDVIVLDLMMPKMSGIQVLNALRAENSTKDVPVLMLTAATKYSEKPDEYWKEKVGVDDYVSKPFEPMDLLRRVEALINLKKNKEK
ncbi:MAG: response regulator [bacterium]|nr:response regulator [bacterium]